MRAEVVCLEKFLATEKYSAVAAANSRVVEDALERGRIESWDRERENPRARDHLDKTDHEQRWLDELTQPFRERAQALRRDPDAE